MVKPSYLGGLIREDRSEIDDKVPFLGDLPGVGRLFRSKVSQSVKTELDGFVTAKLIRATGETSLHADILRTVPNPM